MFFFLHLMADTTKYKIYTFVNDHDMIRIEHNKIQQGHLQQNEKNMIGHNSKLYKMFLDANVIRF